MISPFANLSFKARGYITMLGGTLIHIVLGNVYLWSNMNSYVASYLVMKGHTYSNADIGAGFPIMLLALNLGTPFSVKLAQKFGYRAFILAISIAVAISVFVSSYVLSNFYLFTFLYAFLFGFGDGLLYMIPFNLGFIYFSKKKGLVSGIIAGGFGFASTVFIWIVYALVNPDNETPDIKIGNDSYYDYHVCDNLPRTIRILGIIYLAILLIGCLFIEAPKKEEIEEIQEQQRQETQRLLQLDENHIHKRECETVKDGLKTPFIYVTLLLTAMFACFGTMIVSNYKSYGEENGYSDSFLSTIGIVGGIVNGASRIFWGYLYEKISIKVLIFLNVGLQIILSFTLQWIVGYPALYFIYINLGYFLLGGWFAVMPAIVQKAYGKKIGTTIYFITFGGFTSAGWFSFLVVKDIQATIGWGYMFWIYSGVQLLSLIITYFVKFEIDWNQIYSQKTQQLQYDEKTQVYNDISSYSDDKVQTNNKKQII